MAVNRTKVCHDCEQLEYLIGLGRLPAAYRPVLDDYRSLLAEIQAIGDDSRLVPFDERKACARRADVQAADLRRSRRGSGGTAAGS
jgi:hypothetical protein